jgi:oligopeptidase B
MAEKKTKTTNIHGTTLVDDYFWLREKTNPEVMAHLQAEDDYAQSMMKHTAPLQEKL